MSTAHALPQNAQLLDLWNIKTNGKLNLVVNIAVYNEFVQCGLEISRHDGSHVFTAISDGTANLDDDIEECHAQQNRTGDAGGKDATLKQHFIAFGNILGIVAQSCQ